MTKNASAMIFYFLWVSGMQNVLVGAPWLTESVVFMMKTVRWTKAEEKSDSNMLCLIGKSKSLPTLFGSFRWAYLWMGWWSGHLDYEVGVTWCAEAALRKRVLPAVSESTSWTWPWLTLSCSCGLLSWLAILLTRAVGHLERNSVTW